MDYNDDYALIGKEKAFDDEIMVSVICTAYNHERYIRKCLDGFISQKANFRIEVLVHDDASTDKTAVIIREYEKRYPDIIRAIYQKNNQYSKGIDIIKEYILPLIRGKYVAFCEGDDFWKSPYKLSKQVHALESNKNCFFSVHRVECISENGRSLYKYMPHFIIETGYYDKNDFLLFQVYPWPFQTSSFFINAEWPRPPGRRSCG